MRVPKHHRKDYWKPVNPRKQGRCGKRTVFQSANVPASGWAEKRVARKWNWDAK